ncbi:Ku protein [Polymorphobacter fuscus]|uniref:Non-homologous end joining protein Ku n=1 Tax=Sandarakinorhabdus fusca TaxID=1439888 RepID=A0A7C9GWP5_9SPHN|nr:Ku protein [Polymorphobacter fuscus]KAB7644868.1 Ku protein [Polymorphobacter fuscus]MQT18149.1 Ku protein [Polymorphobacter fuscus]NJC09467.1 DNA end-binding protein Ku [Polymorphobacter fuscus]
MPARAYWTGQLRLALVSIPVEIYSATRSTAGIALNQIHKPSGKRIKLEKTVPGIGEVEAEDIVKGYEIEKGEYVLLSDAELDEVKLESRQTFELVQFVDSSEIDAIYFEKPYYVVPKDTLAEEAFGVIRDALKAAKKVGLGQLAMRGHEHLCSLKPCGRGMIMETLRYADEVNKAQQFFRDIPDGKPPEELLELATALIEKRTAAFDPAKFHDRYDEALRALIDSKRGKKPAPADAPSVKPSNVIDLMAALKESIEKGGKTAAKGAPAKAAAKPAKAAAKTPAKAEPKAASGAAPKAKKRA